jgi:hypothetical protein
VFDPAAEFDVEQLRGQLREMDDKTLWKFGKAAAYMASPQASADGSPPRPVHRVQLEESRAEWRRRHPTHSD